VREELLRFIEEHLNKNIEECSLCDSLTEITKKDLHNIAVDLEYEAFTSSKVVSVYRKKIAKTVKCNIDIIFTLEKISDFLVNLSIFYGNLH
jgi:hypothetical protein